MTSQVWREKSGLPKAVIYVGGIGQTLCVILITNVKLIKHGSELRLVFFSEASKFYQK